MLSHALVLSQHTAPLYFSNKRLKSYQQRQLPKN